MKKFIITITRQFGSLGRPIAKELAELLHIEYYDRDIVDEASKKLGMPVSTIRFLLFSCDLHPFYRQKENPCNFQTNIVQSYMQICSVGLMDRISAS